MCRWLSTKPGMTIMPDASITSASAAVQAGADVDDLVPVRSGRPPPAKSPTSGSRLSTVPPWISVRARRHHPEVETRGVEVGDVGRLRRHGSRSPGAALACSSASRAP